MNVLFINPHYPMSPDSLLLHPPLGYGYMTADIKERGHQAVCLDLPMRSNDIRSELAFIDSVRPDIIGITCVTQSYAQMLEIARFCKQHYPNIPIVVGGPHVTFTPDETLGRHPYIDYIMRYDADRAFGVLLDVLQAGDLSNLTKVPGLAYRDEGSARVVQNDVPGIEMDLDVFPAPDRSIFDMKAYLDHDYETVVMTSRGCPSKCTFCSTTLMGRKYRFHGVERVVDELQSLVDFGFQSVFFGDDTFPVNKERTLALCREIVRRGIRVDFTCNMRVIDAQPEMLDAMVSAGGYRVFTGVETIKATSLKTIHKGTLPHTIRRAVERVKAAGLELHTAYIIGVPGDTPDDIRATLDFIKDIQPTVATFNTMEVRPGTDMFRNPESYGLNISDPYWYEGTSWMDTPVCSTAQLTRQEIREWVERCYYEFCHIDFLGSAKSLAKPELQAASAAS